MLQTAPYEIKDFSGGMTDYYIGALPNRYQTADNLLIEKHGNIGKLVQRPGFEVFSLYDALTGGGGSAYADQLPVGAQRVSALFFLRSGVSGSVQNQRLAYASGGRFFAIDQNDAVFDEFLFPDGSNASGGELSSSTSAAYSISRVNLAKAIVTNSVESGGSVSLGQPVYVKTLVEDGDLESVGLPEGNITGASQSSGTGAFSYVYKVCLVRDGVRGAFEERSVTTLNAVASGAGNLITVTLSSLADASYGTVSQEIYRTTNGGTTFYLVTTVTNATTSYQDVMTDATLVTQEPAYTESGAAESCRPPACRFVHICANRAYYAYTSSGVTQVPERIHQSVTGSPDYAPEDFYVDVGQTIAGLSSVRDTPIVLCEYGNVYRIDGFIDELGGGDMVPTLISSDAPCISGMSVVQAGGELYWAGRDGFYWSDGYRVMLISEGIRETYRTFTNTFEKCRRIVGCFHPGENRIYWTAQVGDSATDCNTLFVLDLNWGVSSDMPFTTWSGGSNFAPTSLAVVDIAYTTGQGTGTLTKSRLDLVHGDTRGYAHRFKDDLLSDHLIDASVGAGNALTLWGYTPIVCNYVSAGMDFGASGVRKWVPSMTVVCHNEGDLSLQINSDNDDGRKTGTLKFIRFRDGDEYTGMIDEFRRFPAGSMRCEFKQIQMTLADVVITSSTETGVLCNVNGTTNQATIASGSWLTDPIGYTISFSNDSYVLEYPITGRTSTVITFTDSGNVAPTTNGLGWVIRGQPKGEKFRLHSYTLNYAPMGQTQTPYHSTTSGEP